MSPHRLLPRYLRFVCALTSAPLGLAACSATVAPSDSSLDAPTTTGAACICPLPDGAAGMPVNVGCTTAQLDAGCTAEYVGGPLAPPELAT